MDRPEEEEHQTTRAGRGGGGGGTEKRKTIEKKKKSPIPAQVERFGITIAFLPGWVGSENILYVCK